MVIRSEVPVPASVRILLVDDNRSGLMARRTVLEELGYVTEGAADAVAALDLFSKKHYDMVVTDYRMPDMDGVELIGKLRAAQPEIPVILISGFVDALGLNEKTTGANSVIMKSANEVQHLIRSVGKLLKTPRKPPARVRSTNLRTIRKRVNG